MKSIFTIISLASISTSCLLALINLFEWYNVKIIGNISDYPFGTEGPTPYYYESAELYSNVCLTWGVLFLIALIFSSIVAFKKSKGIKIAGLGFVMTLVTIMIIQQ